MVSNVFVENSRNREEIFITFQWQKMYNEIENMVSHVFVET